jgi:hypothetical protein
LSSSLWVMTTVEIGGCVALGWADEVTAAGYSWRYVGNNHAARVAPCFQ